MPLADRQICFLLDKEVRDEPLKDSPTKITREPETLKLDGPSPDTPASNIESASRPAKLDLQDSSTLRSSSPEMLSHMCRSARHLATKTPDSTKCAKQIIGKSSEKVRSSTFSTVELKKSMPNRPVPAQEQRRTDPTVSVVAQLPPAPKSQASQSKPSSNSKNVIFHFFLAEEHHGAIPQPLERCETMDSFFDEARAAWGALGEEQHQSRMVAVKVIIEGVSWPVVVLWRNKEGFERMMGTVLKQAAEKQLELNVQVHCFKKG